MVEVGDTAPEFALQGVEDGDISEYSLDSHTADGLVVLAFYVFDFSPVCTPQICDLNDVDLLQFTDDISLFGLSSDGPYAHMRFQEERSISFPLLCDTAQEVGEAYGVLNRQKDGFKRVHQRSLFLLDEDRRVQYRWVAEDNWDDWYIQPVADLKARIDDLRQ